MQRRSLYISHAHADSARCDRYVEALRARGFDVWYDRTNLQAGRSLSDEIQRELRGRSACVVMLTQAAVDSYWMRLETDAYRNLVAHDASRLMMAVRIAPCAVSLPFQGLASIDAVEKPFEAAVDEIARVLGAPAPGQPSTGIADDRGGGIVTPPGAAGIGGRARRLFRELRLPWSSVALALVTTLLVMTFVLRATGLGIGHGWWTLDASSSSGTAAVPPPTGVISTATLTSAPRGAFTEYSIPNSRGSPASIAAGPDGALWFTETAANQIGRITTAGTITEFPLPQADSSPTAITVDPDGALWFTEAIVNRIGRITPAGTITEFVLPSAAGGAPTGIGIFAPPGIFAPAGIIAGADGNLWFAAGYAIGRITPHGAITLFSLSLALGSTLGVTQGPDGAVWFTQGVAAPSAIGRITGQGSIREFPLSSSSTTYSSPDGITSGPDGALWFADQGSADRIGRITTAGAVTEFPLPKGLPRIPVAITAGPNGALWFTESEGNRIGRITTNGVITEFRVPTPYSSPTAITVGPDGALWFTEATGNRIGRLAVT